MQEKGEVMPNKVTIESWGSPETTTVYFDDIPVKGVNRINFNASVQDEFVYLDIGYALFKEYSTPTIEDILAIESGIVNATIPVASNGGCEPAGFHNAKFPNAPVKGTDQESDPETAREGQNQESSSNVCEREDGSS